MLRDPESRGGSIALHEHIAEGDLLQISAPRNHFPLEEGASHSLLLAGGIGITPILSMAERLTQLGRGFTLHYCARTRERSAFLERLARADIAGNVHLHFADGHANQQFDVEAALADRAPDTHLYVCGPTGFIDHVLKAANRKCWPTACLHREYFVAPDRATGVDEAFEVEIASTAQVFVIPPGTSVINELAQHGIYIPTGCDQGVCGTCLTGVLDGVPEHRDGLMNDEQHAANDQFTPCCSRALSARLVLDL